MMFWNTIWLYWLFFFRFADIFSRHHRFFLIGLYVVGGLAFLWFILLVEDILPDSEGMHLWIIYPFETSITQGYCGLFVDTDYSIILKSRQGLTAPYNITPINDTMTR